MQIQSKDIERLVVQAGFDIFGITRAEYLPKGESHFCDWLERGYGDSLEYMQRYKELRFDASKLLPEGRSVVVCGVNYKSRYSIAKGRNNGAGVASYALMRDYHKTIRKRLKGVLKQIQSLYPQTEGRVFTDSAPLLEKQLALNAGIGWIGRQSLIINPQFGSFILLGEIILDKEVDQYNERIVANGCGECRRCIESCPVGAINEERMVDARICIASRTIEMEQAGELTLDGWAFGCDTCQNCCPHNRLTPIAVADDMQPIVTPPTDDEWMAMEQADFEKIAAGTPLKRSSLQRIQQNIRKNRGL
ncbi:MAG: tRNA epoxyqueuosine(34) reductase QueG [Rikenellaceae bacterium]